MEKDKLKELLLNIASFLTSSVFGIVLFGLTIFLIYTFTLKAFDYGKSIVAEEEGSAYSREIVVEIPEDADRNEIAAILKEEGLIDNEVLFLIQSILNGTYKYFKTGRFELNTNMTATELMETLQSTPDQDANADVKITFPEGLTIAQMGSLFESKELFTEEEFLEACNNTVPAYDFFDNSIERENKLEGYLFPDTYEFAKSVTPEQAIDRMLKRFGEVFDDGLRYQANERDLSIDQVITMASIIEEEIVVERERELASAVIYNRLNSETNLEMCSTVMYVLDKRKDRLLLSDLEIESPYNTYVNKGLPVGPISNPGLSSIRAVLNPASVDYLYFVLKDEETGEHFFTDNYDEFIAAKERYNQRF